MDPEVAIKVVACQMIRNAIENWIEEGWEQIPEIGEHDFEQISLRMLEMSREVVSGRFDVAISVLELRAEEADVFDYEL